MNAINNFKGTTTKIGPVTIKSNALGKAKSTRIKVVDPNTGKKLLNIRLHTGDVVTF